MPNNAHIPKESKILYYKVKGALNCTRANDIIPWRFEQCQLRVNEILKIHKASIDNNGKTKDIVDV